MVADAGKLSAAGQNGVGLAQKTLWLRGTRMGCAERRLPPSDGCRLSVSLCSVGQKPSSVYYWLRPYSN
eukprot:6213193-Pleurochrysis_carterae.AAC.8